MSIKYVVGNPGSGKTYFAVHEIYTNSQKYDYVYTNINGFDFEAFNNVKEFKFSNIYEHISHLYSIYSSHEDDFSNSDNNIDLVLIEYCKKHDLYKSLFVIDEVHNVFKEKNDNIITWWLTYHRHLFHEFILITQDLSLVNSEYKRIAEFFYKAVDGQKRLFQNRLKYVQYSNYRMYQNSIIKGGGVELKKDDTIYKIYHSGEYKKVNSFVAKYIKILIFLFILSGVILYFFLDSLSSDSLDKPKPTNKISKTVKSNKYNTSHNNKTKNNKQNNNQKQDILSSDEYVYYISCVGQNCYVGKNYNFIPYSYVYGLFERLKPYRYVFSSHIVGETRFMAIFNVDVFEKFKKKENKDETSEKFFNNASYVPSLPFSSNK